MLKYWVWLSTRDGLSRKGALRVLNHFGSPKAAMFADEEEYALVPGLRDSERAALADKNLKYAEQILEQCGEKNISLLAYADAAYPERLRQLVDAPLLLYWKGRLPAFDTLPTIGVVGTRKATAYGLQTARRLGYQLGQGGGIVVSGMAKGIDARATEGCLSAGQTAVGVLGCGVDVVYPWENRSLFRDMEERGCLISEYVPGTEPKGTNFPVRNRIISGLSLGVVVVEAPAISGAMNTAHQALEQGRDVYAVPGPIDTDAFCGSNTLIRQGATLVTSGWDILEPYLPWFPGRLHQPNLGTAMTLSPEQAAASRKPKPLEETPSAAPEKTTAGAAVAETGRKKEIDKPENKPYSGLESLIPDLSADEQAVVSVLQERSMQADELIAGTQLPAARAMAALTMLQVRGLVAQNAGKLLSLVRD